MTPTIRQAAALFNTTPADIIGRSRFRVHVVPRDAVVWAMRQRGQTFPQIGRTLKRDWTTIGDAYRRAVARRATCATFRRASDALVANN